MQTFELNTCAPRRVLARREKRRPVVVSVVVWARPVVVVTKVRSPAPVARLPRLSRVVNSRYIVVCPSMVLPREVPAQLRRFALASSMRSKVE